MHKKYLPASSPTIITNDLFLAAFLSTVGCTLDRIEKNERRRVSFVFVGERVRELREAYRTGPVHVDMRTFRENLNRLRDRLGETVTSHEPEERSISHAHRHCFDAVQHRRLQPVPQY
jgi:hypothetical protein